MNKVLLFVRLAALFACSGFGLPELVPTAARPGRYSSVSGLAYNTPGGFEVWDYAGPDERGVAKQPYQEEKLFDLAALNNRKVQLARTTGMTQPPGCIWVGQNLWMDEIEIANLHWLEYLHATCQSSTQTHQPGRPLDYRHDPQFRFFPVVGVSYRQAQDFCRWRTATVTECYNTQAGYGPADPGYTVFRFRLPSEAEWQKCAAGGMNLQQYPYGFRTLKAPLRFAATAGQYLSPLSVERLPMVWFQQLLNAFNKSGEQEYIINCRRESHPFLNLTVPFQVWANPANSLGLFNMLGNVAEMTSEEGVAKGGSWRDPLENCRIGSRQHYQGPEPTIGFRCVCVVEHPNQP